jgi:hypothetical protein
VNQYRRINEIEKRQRDQGLDIHLHIDEHLVIAVYLSKKLALQRALLFDLRHLIRPGNKSVAGKLCPIRAVKTGLGEHPKKRGFPEN